MTPDEVESRKVQELVSQDLVEWKRYDELRLGVDRLDRYHRHAGAIVVGKDLGMLLLLSSVRHLRPLGVWIEAVQELEAGVQQEVAEGLLRYMARSGDENRLEAAEAIVVLGSNVLLEAAVSTDLELRTAAIVMLGAAQTEGSNRAIIESMQRYGDMQTARLGCLALGEIGSADGLSTLLGYALDEREEVGAAAVSSLGGFEHQTAFERIADALESSDSDLVEAAQRAIGRSASVDLVRHLVNASDLDDRRLRLIIGGIDRCNAETPAMIRPLRKAIRDASLGAKGLKSGWVQDQISKAGGGRKQKRRVKRVTLPSGEVTLEGVLLLLDGHVAPDVAAALVERGSDVLPVLRELAQHETSKVRTTVLMTLRRMRGVPDSHWRTYIRPPLLESALGEEDADSRYYACLAIAKLGMGECVTSVRPLVHDQAEGSWFQPDVGRRVSDAANVVLDKLAPESRASRREILLEL